MQLTTETLVPATKTNSDCHPIQGKRYGGPRLTKSDESTHKFNNMITENLGKSGSAESWSPRT